MEVSFGCWDEDGRLVAPENDGGGQHHPCGVGDGIFLDEGDSHDAPHGEFAVLGGRSPAGSGISRPPAEEGVGGAPKSWFLGDGIMGDRAWVRVLSD